MARGSAAHRPASSMSSTTTPETRKVSPDVRCRNACFDTMLNHTTVNVLRLSFITRKATLDEAVKCTIGRARSQSNGSRTSSVPGLAYIMSYWVLPRVQTRSRRAQIKGRSDGMKRMCALRGSTQPCTTAELLLGSLMTILDLASEFRL